MTVYINGTTGYSGPVGLLGDLTTTGNTILGDASTDTLNVGNGNLVLDSSGNAGLGVTPSAWSASYKAIQLGGGTSIWSGASGNQPSFYSNNLYFNGSNRIYLQNGYATEYVQSTSGTHSWYNAPSGTAGNAITFTQAMTLNSSGYLGVVTTSPDSFLHVEKTGTASLRVGFTGASQNYYDADVQFFRLGNATEQMRLNSTGLGIGTSSPASKLTNQSSNIADAAGLSSGTQAIQWQTSVQGYTATFYNSGAGSQFANGLLVKTTGTSNDSDAIVNFESGGVNRLKLTGRGNLGLGASPSDWLGTIAALQMKNGACFYGQPSGTSGDAGMSANQYVNTSGSRIYIANGYATFYDQKGDTGVHRWFNAPSGTAGSGISFTQAMTLDASGNLGVGTTSPANKLDVYQSNSGIGAGLISHVNGNYVNVQPSYNYYGAYNHIFQSLSGTTEYIRINDSGNVILGYNRTSTTQVSKTFATSHASGNRGAEVRFGLEDGSFGGMVIPNVASSNPSFNAQYIQFFTHQGAVSAGERMRITPDGNVGVGTTSPSQKLTVVGNLKSAGAQNGNVAKAIFTRTDYSWSINNETDLRFYNGSGDTDSPATLVATMDSSGNLSFGSTWGYIKQFSSFLGIGSGNVALMFVDDGTPRVIPRGNNNQGANGTIDLGDAGSRYKALYAVNGTIQTSDAREKTEVVALTANEIEAAKQLANEIGTYKWLEAATSKGFDNARKHIGMTVQRAIEVMEANGLDAMKYGFICYDTWPEEKNEKGELIRPAGDSYSFRTDQLSIFISCGQQAIIQQLQADVAALKGTA